MILCECRQPVRDTADPDRRHRCGECGGATPSGRRVTLDETRRLAQEAHSLVDKIVADLAYATESAYGIQGPGEGLGRPSGHSDPTGRAVASRRSDSAQYCLLASQWVKQAVAWLRNADEAAGLALYTGDPHRGPVDHTPAPFHDPAALYPGRPDLQTAHAARLRRQGRGEL